MKLQFRIPISPTPGFFSQVRAFDFGLRRLGGDYRDAELVVCVGDDCDIEDVRRRNGWSGPRVRWEAVPVPVFDEFGMYGTASWRLAFPCDDAEVVLLCDADTVLLRDLDPLLAEMPRDRPAVRGHMAHIAPPIHDGVDHRPSPAGFWPTLFDAFALPWPPVLHRYSMMAGAAGAYAPAYFNLGFVALNPAGLEAFAPLVFETHRRLDRLLATHMRCQVIVTLIAHLQGLDIGVLPAPYNAANDSEHMRLNLISASDIRLLHYLRGDELDRQAIFTEAGLPAFLRQPLRNEANIALQALAREYADVLAAGAGA